MTGIEVRSAKSRRYQRLRRRRLAKRADAQFAVPADTDPGPRENWVSPCHGDPNLCGSRDREQREFLARTGRCCADLLEEAAS